MAARFKAVLRSPGRLAGGAFLFAQLFAGATVQAADGTQPQPTLEMTVSTTNLVVTEELTVTLRLWMPPLEGESFAEIPPVMDQRPPHFTVPFWTPDWKTSALTLQDPQRIPPLETDGARTAPVFTLNDYVTDGLGSLRGPLGGRDPFASLFDDDFFGRSLGPRPATFPFTVRRVKRGDVNGWEFTVSSLPYRAVAPGHVLFNAVQAKIPVITAVRTVRDRFGRATAAPTIKEVTLRTRACAVDVVEPTTVGRPASYCGAISSNLVVTASLDTNVCTAGDPLMLTLDVSGVTDLSTVVAPSFADVFKKEGVFRLDEASLKTETLANSRRFTWRVRPLKAGTVEFPALPVSFYDLSKRAYATRLTESMPVQVRAGVQAALGTLDDESADVEAFPMPDGLDYDSRGAASEPLLPHLGLALALFLVPPVLFTLIRLTPPVRRRVAAQRRAARRASAYAICRRALKGRDPDKRAAAIRRFFEDRYGVKGATVTGADARRLMADDFTDGQIAEIVGALAEADRTHYSARKTVVALVLICLASLSVFGASPAFTYRRAGSLATRATDEAGFKAAAKAYAECLQEGAANPILYTNLGTCELMGGNPRAALTAFACAERRSGQTETTRRGIRAALARQRNDPRADLPLTRAFCAPHVLFPLDARLLFAAGAWALFWLLLLLPCGGLRRTLVALCVLAFVASAVSVSVSLASEQIAKGVEHVGR